MLTYVSNGFNGDAPRAHGESDWPIDHAVAEVALVLQHHIQGLLGSLNEYVEKTEHQSMSECSTWPIEVNNVDQIQSPSM